MSDDNNTVLHNDLFELLEMLGMPTAARPESPHAVFQEALRELRTKLETLDAFRERLRTITHAAKREEGESAFSLSCVVDACHALASEGLRMSDEEREAFLASSAPDMRSPMQEPPYPTSVRILMSDGSTWNVNNQALENHSYGPGHQPRSEGPLRRPPTTGSGVKPSARPPLWMRLD